MNMSFIRLRPLPRYQVWAYNFLATGVLDGSCMVEAAYGEDGIDHARGRTTKMRVSKEHSRKSSWSRSFCHSFEEAKVLIEQWR